MDEHFEKLYQNPLTPEESFIKQFPETDGVKLDFNAGIQGGSPDTMIIEEAGLGGMGLFNQINQQLIQELQKKSKRNTAEDMSMGGVEPPVLMTANDMAEELEGLPRSFVEAALDPLDTGAVNEILEGLRRQGDEVAVAIDRRSEFEKPSAQSLIDAMQKIDLVDNNGNSHIVYTSQSQMDVYSNLLHDQEKSLLFGSPEKKPVLESHRMVVTDLTQDYVRRHGDMIMSAGMAMGVNPEMFDIPGSEK